MAEIAPDPLATLATPEVQRQAAATVQDVFGRLFRISADQEAGASETQETLTTLGHGLANWTQAGVSDDARILRRVMLLAGLDQWGLAYCQAFGLVALPALSRCVGDLRTALDPRSEARFQQFFDQVQQQEISAIEFKIDLRRGIHLALWHAMIACDTPAAGAPILAHLGGALVALNNTMPALGWRLVADTLAHIQLRCARDGLASEGVAQQLSENLFGALRQSLGKDTSDQILALSRQALLDWLRAGESRI